MSAYNIPDYRTKFFEYKDLDKIHGQPTLQALVKLLRQLKRNAQKVPTTLGGGQLGYLALILSVADYLSIPGSAPFHRPTDPGVFTPIPHLVPPGPVLRGHEDIGPLPLTSADITTQRIAHDERRRLYNECQAVETVLRNQLIEAIDDEYIRPLRNPHTDMVNDPITTIFTFLHKSYGKITTGQFKVMESEIDDLIYDPATNVDKIFNKIQDFQDLCLLIGKTKSDTQLVDMAYLIFQKSGIFRDTLLRWNQKPSVDKTFVNLTLFMRQEYLDLQEVGGLTVNNSLHNQANLVQEIQDLKAQQIDLVSNLKNELSDNIVQTLRALSLTDENGNENNYDMNNGPVPSCPPCHDTNFAGFNPSPYDYMNSASQPNNPMITQLLAQIADLQSQVNSGKGSKTRVKPKNVSSDLINPKTGQPWRRYCWSCGCCPHWGRNCKSKKRGHQDEATFRNRMNGSNENCL